MITINPYLNFDGNTEEAFHFYKSVFGGDFASLQRFKDMPGAGGMPKEEGEKIMHIALSLGKAGILMGSDTPGSMRDRLKVGTNVFIMLNAESEKEAERLFKGLSAGGMVEMPLQKMFWGALYASFTDRYGVQWMINFDYGRQG